MAGALCPLRLRAPDAGGVGLLFGSISPIPADFNRFAVPRNSTGAAHLLTFGRIITVCHLDSKKVSNRGINHALVIALAQQGVRQHKDLEILFIN